MEPRNFLRSEVELIDILTIEAQARAMRAAVIRGAFVSLFRAIAARLRRAPVGQTA